MVQPGEVMRMGEMAMGATTDEIGQTAISC